MSDLYAPNQQVVRGDGSGPAEEGSGGSAPAEPEPGPTGYDPGADTVADVQAYVEAHPDRRATVLAAEKAGKNRTTLVDWLSGG
jgi:hypothetical protein